MLLLNCVCIYEKKNDCDLFLMKNTNIILLLLLRLKHYIEN